MPICFFDTSALAKYYHEEIGTQHVISLIDTPDNRIYISRLALTEWHSAFTRKVRIGTLPISNFQIAKQTFYSDLRNRRLIIINLERVHQHHAVRLLKNYGLTQNLPTLDALQLAVALDLNNHTHLDHFVCADIPFCQIARQEGLPVLNPESP